VPVSHCSRSGCVQARSTSLDTVTMQEVGRGGIKSCLDLGAGTQLRGLKKSNNVNWTAKDRDLFQVEGQLKFKFRG
jgi:hypothetical protein